METKTIKVTAINKLLEKSSYKHLQVAKEFNRIISEKISGYDGGIKDKLKAFLEDMTHGCQSGMIRDFIYNSDCKKFYIKHIDELEEMKADLENSIRAPIENKQQLPHYTFMCWLCFEEYCYNLDNIIFNN